jgi:hypothetical protein
MHFLEDCQKSTSRYIFLLLEASKKILPPNAVMFLRGKILVFIL